MFLFNSPTYTVVFLFVFMFGLYLVAQAIQFLNDLVVEQFSVLNNQLQLELIVEPRRRFSFKRRYPLIKGKYLNRRLMISSKEVMIAGVAYPQTVIVVDVLHYGKTFTIGSETIYTILSKLWGKNDISLNDPLFDRMFYLTANDAAFLQKVLDPDIRDIMKANMFLQDGKFTLNQAQLRYEEQISVMTVSRRKRIEKIILIMYMMAKKIDHLGG
ncbi:MAG TPA: hypothetical protein PK239_16245 [Chitinophagales bacterium]|nr:hypothetical protein [Chitinophagales bacterium]